MILVLAMLVSQSRADEKVYVYNWTEYIPESLLKRFTVETGIEVVYTTFDSNETMYAKLKLIQKDGYDVVIPSTYYVSKMGREGMLLPLDRKRLTHFDNLDPALLNKAYDPGNRFSVPYMWGSTGIAVNAGVIDPATVTSWKSLWDPKYKGQLLLHDDVREVFHMALKIKGYSSNATDPEQIREAYEILRTLMPNVLLFNSDSPRLPYLAGEVNLGMIWNGEAWMAQKENRDILYIYPSEGVNLWMDNFVIPKSARNFQAAHAFINYMLKPEAAKACVEEYGYATPNRAGLQLLDEKMRTSPVIFPAAEIVANGEFQTDVGEAINLYQKYWEKLRSGQ